MSEQKSKFPPLFLTACTFFCLGIMGLFSTLWFAGQTPWHQGFFLISSSLVGIGIGEILNHPKEHVVQSTAIDDGHPLDYYRRRSTTGLGNLLIIVAILLFFGGVSSLMY